jgi:hypothetical protein
MVKYVAGLTKESVRVVMDAPFVGAYEGTGKTITQAAPAALEVDGVTLALNDRVLLAAQTDKTQNGIYTVTTLGDGSTAAVLTRAADFDDSADLVPGTIIPVSAGTASGGTTWKLLPATVPATLDTTVLEFKKQSADTTRVVEMTSTLTGDDTTVSYPVTHNWGTMNVTHELYDAATGETAIAQFTRTSANAVKVDVGAPLGTGTNLVLVIRAEVDPS